MYEENNIGETETQYEEVSGEKVKNKYEIDYPRLFVLILLLSVVAFIFYFLLNKENDVRVAEEKRIVEEQIQKELTNPFNDISITGKAAYVWDIKTQERIFGYNEEEQLPLASLTKLMTIFTASNILSSNKIITITLDSLKSEGDSGLYSEERWNLKDLIDFTLLVSSNDGASAIASAAGSVKLKGNNNPEKTSGDIFIDEMNKKARLLGLTQTYFLNETGLDPNEEISGGYGSVRDIAILLENILIKKPEIVNATTHYSLDIQSIDNYIHSATNTNKSIGNIPGLIASKTGFTDLAGGNLVIAFDAGLNRPIIVAVLGSTQEERFEDVEKLVLATLELLTQ